MQNPFVDTVVTEPSGTEISLTSPVRIGALLGDLPAGPVGRFDLGSAVEIYLPSVSLSSLSDAEISSGGNFLAVETPQGWEILQAANIDLVDVDTYRISRLLRGQFGTDHVMGVVVPSGARIVYLGQGWQDIQLSPDLRGENINFTLSTNGRETAEIFTHSYQGNHLRPLSPVHIKVVRTGDMIEINWIRRTRVGGDDWAPLDVPLGEETERYEVAFMDGDEFVLVVETETPSLQTGVTELETAYGYTLTDITFRVSQISQNFGTGTTRLITIDI